MIRKPILSDNLEPIQGYRLEQYMGGGTTGEVWRSSAPGRNTVALKLVDVNERSGLRELRSVLQMKSIRQAHLLPVFALWLLNERLEVLPEDELDKMFNVPVAAPSVTLTLRDLPSQQSCRYVVLALMYCDKTLADRLKECRKAGMTGIPVDELLRYMEEAAKGIDYLNSPVHRVDDKTNQPVQHCDIKPSNILLVGNSAVVGDFGLVHILNEQSLTATTEGMKGSPAYMSPECAKRVPSLSSDQYSLACTYYELRSGKLPFALPAESLTLGYVLNTHATGALDFSSVSEPVQAALKRATAVEPEQRFETALALVEALSKAEEAIADPPPPPPPWRLWQALALAALACCAALTYYALQSGSHGQFLLQAIPPGAKIFVDDIEQRLNANGMAAVNRQEGKLLKVRVTHGAEYVDEIREIEAGEQQTNSVVKIELRKNALFLVNQSKELLSKGQFDKAIEVYVAALESNPHLDVVPEPILLRSPLGGGKCSREGVSVYGKLLALGMSEAAYLFSLEQAASAPIQIPKLEVIGQFPALKPVKQLFLTRDRLISIDGEGTGSIQDLNSSDKNEPTFRLGSSAFKASVSPDHQWLISAGSIESTEKNAYLVQKWNLPRIHAGGKPETMGRHGRHVTSFAWSDDGRQLCAGDFNGVVKSYPMEDGAPMWEYRPESAESKNRIVCMTSGKMQVYIGGAQSEDKKPNVLTSIAWRDGQAKLLVSKQGPISCIAVSPAQDLLATGCDGGQVVLFTLESNGDPSSPLLLPDGHRDPDGRAQITQILFDAERPWMFTGGTDGQVIAWNLSTKRGWPLLREPLSEIVGLYFTPRGDLLAIDVNGGVRSWNKVECQAIISACQRLKIPSGAVKDVKSHDA